MIKALDIDPEWLVENAVGDGLDGSLVTAKCEAIKNDGGYVGRMFHLNLEYAESCDTNGETWRPKRCVVKALGGPDLADDAPMRMRFIALGLAREALVYRHLAPKWGSLAPRCLAAFGDLTRADKLVVLEDLSITRNTAGKGQVATKVVMSRETINMEYPDKETLEEWTVVLGEIFTATAKFHATYWQDRSLLEHTWLRFKNCIPPESAETKHEEDPMWRGSQQYAASAWVNRPTEDKMRWDPHLVACVEASFAKISWEDYSARMKSEGWTLCSGDFHSGNVWLDLENATNPVTFLDFEVVGIGSGPQELGQFMISTDSPMIRRAIENLVVQKYHAELVACWKDTAGSTPTFDQIWREYVNGGAGRWFWFMGIVHNHVPIEKYQQLHDSFATFLKDHFPDPASVPQPRP